MQYLYCTCYLLSTAYFTTYRVRNTCHLETYCRGIGQQQDRSFAIKSRKCSNKKRTRIILDLEYCTSTRMITLRYRTRVRYSLPAARPFFWLRSQDNCPPLQLRLVPVRVLYEFFYGCTRLRVVAVPFILYLVRFCSPKPCKKKYCTSTGTCTEFALLAGTVRVLIRGPRNGGRVLSVSPWRSSTCTLYMPVQGSRRAAVARMTVNDKIGLRPSGTQ